MSFFNLDSFVSDSFKRERFVGPPFKDIITNRSLLTNTGNKLAEYLKLDIHDGPWLAGGSVRKMMNREVMSHSDWDIFFKDNTQFALLSSKLRACREGSIIFSSNNAETFSFNVGHEVHIQLIKRKFYNSVEDLLDDFDFGICKYATDGYKLKVGETTFADENNKTITCEPDKISRAGFIKRLIKYISYGYTPDKELINHITNNELLLDFNTEVSDYEF